MPIIKEKKPRGLIFSLCKMSVLVGKTEQPLLCSAFYIHSWEQVAAALQLLLEEGGCEWG